MAKRERRVISLVGGGGKTTTMYALAEIFREEGKKVIVTTSTHLQIPPEEIRAWNIEEVRSLWKSDQIAVIGTDCESNKNLAAGDQASVNQMENKKSVKKMRMPDGSFLQEVLQEAEVVLIEADGAKHHPVKVPEKWEPVIPRCADIVISVIGLDCLGQPISQSAYRMERTSEFLRKSLEAPITEEDIVKIATSICGLFKDVEERVYRVYLNKSDILREKEPAEHIVEELERKNTVAAYGSLLEE